MKNFIQLGIPQQFRRNRLLQILFSQLSNRIWLCLQTPDECWSCSAGVSRRFAWCGSNSFYRFYAARINPVQICTKRTITRNILLDLQRKTSSLCSWVCVLRGFVCCLERISSSWRPPPVLWDSSWRDVSCVRDWVVCRTRLSPLHTTDQPWSEEHTETCGTTGSGSQFFLVRTFQTASIWRIISLIIYR